MARIRSIKPEVCSSPTVAELSVHAQLLWERLWCFCDSEGRMDFIIARIKGDLVPLVDEFTLGLVQSCMEEMAKADLIAIYAVEKRKYLQVVNWSDHQKIKNESASKIPPLPAITQDVGTVYGQNEDTLPEMSTGEVGSRKGEVGSRKRDSNSTTTVFHKPTVQELSCYCDERGWPDYSEHFYEHFESCGWTVKTGKAPPNDYQPMKSWKLSMQTWHRNQQKFSKNTAKSKEGGLTDDELERYNIPELTTN